MQQWRFLSDTFSTNVNHRLSNYDASGVKYLKIELLIAMFYWQRPLNDDFFRTLLNGYKQITLRLCHHISSFLKKLSWISEKERRKVSRTGSALMNTFIRKNSWKCRLRYLFILWYVRQNTQLWSQYYLTVSTKEVFYLLYSMIINVETYSDWCRFVKIICLTCPTRRSNHYVTVIS